MKMQTAVENERFAGGFHSITFEARNLQSGVYFYRIEAGSFKAVKKLILTQ